MSVPSVLVFDTETTGIGSRDQILQLAYICFDAEGKELSLSSRYWKCLKPVQPGATLVNGITTEQARSATALPRDEIPAFLSLVDSVGRNGGVVVAHNAKFDVRMLVQTAAEWNIPVSLPPVPVFCTLAALRRLPVQVRGVGLRNSEVYERMGGEPLEGRFHEALNDCRATGFIFFEGRERGWWG